MPGIYRLEAKETWVLVPVFSHDGTEGSTKDPAKRCPCVRVAWGCLFLGAKVAHGLFFLVEL